MYTGFLVPMHFNDTPGFDVIKFQLEISKETYYFLLAEDSEDYSLMYEFAEAEGTDIQSWGLETRGLPVCCLAIGYSKQIYVN